MAFITWRTQNDHAMQVITSKINKKLKKIHFISQYKVLVVSIKLDINEKFILIIFLESFSNKAPKSSGNLFTPYKNTHITFFYMIPKIDFVSCHSNFIYMFCYCLKKILWEQISTFFGYILFIVFIHISYDLKTSSTWCLSFSFCVCSFFELLAELYLEKWSE
jgi:hypothetical protein